MGREEKEELPEIDELASSFVRSSYNQPVSMGDVFRMEKQEDFANLYRYNKMESLSFTIFGGNMDSEGLKHLVEKVVGEIRLPTGYMLVVDPEANLSIKRRMWLRWGFFIAIWLVGLCLVLILNDIKKVWMCFSIFPGTFLGMFLAQALGRLGGSESFMLGAILLVGMVVNNTVLVFAETKVSSYRFVYHWFQALEKRFFPLLTTNITTLVGLFPLFFVSGETRSLWVPLALTVILGLSSSLIFQLLFSPLFLHKREELHHLSS